MRIGLLLISAIVLGVVVGAATARLRLDWIPWQGYVTGGSADPRMAAVAGHSGEPHAVAEQTEFDFGTMDIAAEGAHSFAIKNLGTADLELTAGGTSCGCTSLELPKGSISPGQSGAIAVRWRPRGGVGPLEQGATVLTNDPHNSRIELSIVGKITAPLQVLPSEVALGQFAASESARGAARVYAYRADHLALTEGRFSDLATADKFVVNLEPLSPERVREEADARSGVLLRITAKSGLPLGPIRQTITLQTDLSECPTIEVPIEGVVTGDISIFGMGWDGDRQVLKLGVVGQQGIQRTLIILTRGPHRREVNFRLAQVVPPLLDVKLEPPVESNQGAATRAELTIRVPAGMRGMNFMGPRREGMGTITIETGHPQVPTLRIYVGFAVEG
jgi:hypothetical protein